jgi:hypothetical protein
MKLNGSVLHHWLMTGIAAASFIWFLKVIVGPKAPAGAQKLIGSI